MSICSMFKQVLAATKSNEIDTSHFMAEPVTDLEKLKSVSVQSMLAPFYTGSLRSKFCML